MGASSAQVDSGRLAIPALGNATEGNHHHWLKDDYLANMDMSPYGALNRLILESKRDQIEADSSETRQSNSGVNSANGRKVSSAVTISGEEQKNQHFQNDEDDIFLTSTSDSEPRPKLSVEERIKRVQNKFMALHAFLEIPQSKVHKEPEPDQRDSLMTFIESQKDDARRCIEEILNPEVDELILKPDKYRTRPRTPKPTRTLIPRPDGNTFLLRLRQGHCAICQETLYDAYPCRVCDRMFHLKCLQDSRKYPKGRDVEGFVKDRALTVIGWSCYHCDDLSTLLTDAELEVMMEEFDKYDINRDNGINLPEYIAINRQEQLKHEDGELSDLDLVRMRMQFQSMDLDGDGTVDYWEFIKYETTKSLARRDKEDLVKLLTTKEVLAADQLFRTFDRDRDGRLSETEVKAVFRDWYSRLEDNSRIHNSTRERQKSLQLHVRLQSQIVFGSPEAARDGLTWDDFLREQAIYMICSRPNRALFGKKKAKNKFHKNDTTVINKSNSTAKT